MVGAVLTGLVLVASQAVPTGVPAPAAHAHATCDGADHTDWHITLTGAHRDEWRYERSRSIDSHRYRNYFWNETHDYGKWSDVCPS